MNNFFPIGSWADSTAEAHEMLVAFIWISKRNYLRQSLLTHVMFTSSRALAMNHNKHLIRASCSQCYGNLGW